MVELAPWREVVILAGYGLTAFAVFIVARMLLKEEESRAAQENLEELSDRQASNALVRMTRPFFSQYVVPMIRGKKMWDNVRKSNRRRLITAGLKNELTPDELISFKFFLIIFFPTILGILKSIGMIDLSNYLIFGSGIAGWFYPDLWIRSRIESRHRSIRKSLPFIVDLLALSTEAGLDFVGAIGKVVDKAKSSPLVDELEQLLKEIKVGSSRADALREMSLRVNMTEVNSFVAILISADQMGAPIGRTLRQQGDQIRNDRFVRAEKAGAIAAQKLLLPLVIFILPAVMLMIFGPFLLSLMGGTSSFY